MTRSLRLDVVGERELRFDDGSPVRAASAITTFENGWLVVSDDATHAALWVGDSITPVRVIDPVEGHEVFDEASGTKKLKPDFEAVCRVEGGDNPAVLLLGSGSSRARMRGVLLEERTRQRWEADLQPVYERVAAALDVPLDSLNLEAACWSGPVLRWFQRGNEQSAIPSASVELDLGVLLGAIRGEVDPAAVEVGSPTVYDLSEFGGSSLALTDAVVLPDGRILASAAGEDTSNAVDDGEVVDAALALLDGGRVVATATLPEGPGGVAKVEGLVVTHFDAPHVRLIGVVDADDPDAPSKALEMRVELP